MSFTKGVVKCVLMWFIKERVSLYNAFEYNSQASYFMHRYPAPEYRFACTRMEL